MKLNFIIQNLKVLLFGMLMAFFTLQSKAWGTNNHALEDIHQQVYFYLKQNLDQQIIDPLINVRPLSAHVSLAQCQSKLQLSQRATQTLAGRQTVLVECMDPAWRVFVTAEIDGKISAVVARQGILRQAIINPSDVELRAVPINEVRRGWLESVENVVHARAKRAIRPNTVINLTMLDPPYWVIDKQEVTIITQVSGLEIRTTGIALSNAMQHEQVEVRNKNSNIVITGIVIAPNTVSVP
ncbi:flagellar basal body P-ring formation protein FlgA [Thiomicrospira microaerophila]|uniref:flagellar basal body P-ring formation chaperone FlgA n=1 Tax=Thiomicrospira microaerophila TaxID=406020 RepID=UPI00200CE856|nr:flagellar basal body P-ring formation chaperone FlgA [Thiomicrospira microaerophila]UQB42656.1 flagellar basal body P-ring formation protein FlgA [Thiomicrospira microaerophila]